MAIDYQKTAKDLVKELGGDGNISNVTHCATRLRFILKDESIVDKEKVAKIKGVITTVQAGGQFQVVIGNHVTDAYKYVMELVTVDDSTSEGTGNKKAGVVSRIIDVISAIFAPFLYTLAACGILQGILGVLVALNAIDTTGGTYRILNFISWTAFTFLPVLIAVTAAKKFKVDTFISLVIACALVCPDYTAMDIAAAFLYQAMGASEISTAESKDDYDFHNTGAEDGMVRLFINVGKKDKIKPGDILGAIAGESGMPGRLVGAIDMYDKYTFVEVPAEYGKEVLNAMKNAKIKGRSVNMEPANSR